MKNIAEETRTNILQEQFIPDNVFIYVAKGAIRVFDGNKSQTFKAGDACIARKNRLAKYELLEGKDAFEPILICFDEPFLRTFHQKHAPKESSAVVKDTLIQVQPSELTKNFILSIQPYYTGVMQLDEAFQELKYQELLIILLQQQPELASVFFDFRKPGKIDLEEFMTRNYKFNVSNERFAFLTGRSISAFKRDFKEIFNDTPSHWLTQRRLQEARFLIEKENKKPSDFYLSLGFESLSHFSVAFKKQYGITPSEVMNSVK